MASSSAKECGVCQEVFDEKDRCPRMLPCFHCFCTYCLDRLIQGNTKVCPFCRLDFEASSFLDLKINNGMIDLLKYMAVLEASTVSSCKEASAVPPNKEASAVPPNKEASVVPPTKPASISSPEWLNAFRKNNDEIRKENLAICQKVENKIANSICLNNILRSKVENELISKISEISLMYHRKVKFLEEENEKLEMQLAGIKLNEKRIEVVKERLEAATTFMEAAPAMDEAGKANVEIQSLIGNMTTFIAEDEKRRQGIEKIVQNTEQKLEDVREVLSSEEDAGINPTPDMSALVIQDPEPDEITIESLRKMSASVKDLVREGKIYALQDKAAKLRFAKISINSDDKLSVHCLTDALPPPGIHVLKHSDVMEHLDPYPKLAFLKLTGIANQFTHDDLHVNPVYADVQEFHCHLHFRLPKDTLGAKQFVYLCTGELGPSYKDSKILKVFDEGTGMERVLFGDYQSNNGNGGRALVAGVAQEGKVGYDTSWLAGSLVGKCDEGDKKAAQFYIRLGDMRGLKCNSSFGRLEEGLEDLKKGIFYVNGQHRLVISDCGMVLNSQ